MRKTIVIIIILVFSTKIKANNEDSTTYFKRILKQNYTELDSNFKDELINNEWKLIATYNRNFLFHRELKISPYYHTIKFSDSLSYRSYGSTNLNRVYTTPYVFHRFMPSFLIFMIDIRERYGYQILRFEDNYMIVNEYIYVKGKLKNPKRRLLFEKIRQ